MKKKVLTVLVTALMIAVLIPLLTVFVSAADDYGFFGEKDCLKWEVKGDTLTITGSGAMPDYNGWSKYPWSDSWRSIKNVVIGDEVTHIGSYAFDTYYFTESIKLGDGVKSIGKYAFYKTMYNSGSDLVIPENVTSIGDYAFAYLYNLKDVVIKSNNINIGNEAFYCSTIERLSIGTPMISCIINGVTESGAKKISIGEYSFGYCNKLTDVFLSNALSTLGKYSFYSCNKLGNVFFSGMEDEFKAIGKLNNNGNDNLKNASAKKYLPDLYNFSQADEYYKISGKEDLFIFKSPFDIIKNAKYPFRPGIEYDDEGSWYVYPTGEKTDKVKYDPWNYDENKCWRTLPNGHWVLMQDLKWETNPYYHYHELPDGKIIHRTLHTDSGKCEACGYEGGFTAFPYTNEKGELVLIPDGCKTLTTDMTTLTDGWYIVDSELNYKGTRLQIAGDVKLILLDTCGITTSGGIGVQRGKTLSIYSESLTEHDGFKPGYIEVTGAPLYCAGIGGNDGAENVTVNIYGGHIHSYGGYSAAGIGSGGWGSSTVNIFNGYVDSVGGIYGPGIGSAYDAHADVTIHAGTVIAWGGQFASGIGIADIYSAAISTATVRISDKAVVEAHGGKGASDIDGRVPYIGSLISQGDIWIIAGVALACAAVVVFFVIKNKKKAE